jgi:hypothetical protein
MAARVFLTAALAALGLVACARFHPPPLNVESIAVGGGRIKIEIDPHLTVSHEEVIEWVRRAAAAVSGYLERFPVKHLVIVVHGGGREPIGEGATYGDTKIEVQLSSSVRHSELENDWILTHEMFHLAFPTLDRRYLWMMEGLSDYLEPVARARAGQLEIAAFWRELVEGLPQGLPGPGDQGLDNTHTWERTYWGGDLFWLLADVQIRAKTDNRRSVNDAIRAINAAGGTGSANWTLERVLRVGDEATGTTVLADLHKELGAKPGQTDLAALWKKLGVKYRFGRISVDDAAPWAAIRAAITTGPVPPAKMP